MNRSKLFLALVACALASAAALTSVKEVARGGVAAAQAASASAPASNPALPRYEALTYKDKDGKELSYLLLKPKDYDKAKKYPLVLFLHGAGERGSDNKKQLCNGAQVLSEPEMMAKFPCFQIVPQCPPNPASWTSRRASTQPGERSGPLALALEIVKQTQKDFSIDENRLYVTGLSMGGYGTWALITQYPEMWAAAVPVCGGGNPSQVKPIVDAKLPIWVWHGEKDGAVPVKSSRDMVKALKDAGLEVKYTETPDQGHNEWDKTYYGDEMWKWMFEQKKAQK